MPKHSRSKPKVRRGRRNVFEAGLERAEALLERAIAEQQKCEARLDELAAIIPDLQRKIEALGGKPTAVAPRAMPSRVAAIVAEAGRQDPGAAEMLHRRPVAPAKPMSEAEERAAAMRGVQQLMSRDEAVGRGAIASLPAGSPTLDDGPGEVEEEQP
jgi:hypothetical protein